MLSPRIKMRTFHQLSKQMISCNIMTAKRLDMSTLLKTISSFLTIKSNVFHQTVSVVEFIYLHLHYLASTKWTYWRARKNTIISETIIPIWTLMAHTYSVRHECIVWSVALNIVWNTWNFQSYGRSWPFDIFVYYQPVLTLIIAAKILMNDYR